MNRGVVIFSSENRVTTCLGFEYLGKNLQFFNLESDSVGKNALEFLDQACLHTI